MSYPLNYTNPEVRIPFNIPHAGSWAFTSLSVVADPKKRQIEFEKLLSYTSCPQESVVFTEKVPIASRDALKECAGDMKCKEFVNYYIFKKGFTVSDNKEI